MHEMEKINALTIELNQYKNLTETLNAEKTALDQMYVESIKNILSIRKDNVLNGEKIKKLSIEIEVANKEKECLLKEIENITNDFEEFKSKYENISMEAQ
jgi:hypothetical protein